MMKQILLPACLILVPAGAGAMDDPCRHGGYSYAEVDPAPRHGGGTLEVWPDVTCIEVPRRAGRELGPISVYVDPNGAAPEQPDQGRQPLRRR